MPDPASNTDRAMTILAAAGHDLNNELTMVLGGIFEALAKLQPDDPARADLVETRDAAQRCCAMAVAMLAVAAR